MQRLARVRPLHIALACAAWIAVVAFLPQLTLLALQLHARVQSLLSPTGNQARAIYVRWGSQRAMLVAVAAPPLLLLFAWMVSRLVHRR